MLHPDIRKALAEHKETNKQELTRLFDSIDGSEKATAQGRQVVDFANTPSDSGTAPLDGQPSNDDDPQMLPVAFGDEGEVQSLDKPHMAKVFKDGSKQFIPHTDYWWTPSSAEDGIKVLREHIKDLEQEREEQRAVANQLWLSLSSEENAFCLAQDEEHHYALRTELIALSAMYASVFTRMSNLSRMIADAKKTIKHLDASQTIESKSKDRGLFNADALGRVHKEIITGMYDNLEARIQATQEALKWLRDRIREFEEAYARLAQAISDNSRAIGLNVPVNDKNFDKGWVEELKKKPVDEPFGVNLRVLKQLEAEKLQELGNLRDEYWSKKGG